MRFFAITTALLACLVSPSVSTDSGLTKLVEWDKYSLSVNGSRQFIMSAEMHYMRLPVPELWLDVFQKFKAEGFNTVSIYFFWSWHSPAKDEYDFTSGAKDIQKLFDYAKQAGIWVITRAGPYCNAETSAGGLALWLSDGSGGRLRTSDAVYYNQWKPWIERVGKIIAANQITEGGPVILNQHENELTQTRYDPEDTLVKYMIQIDEAFEEAGIIVPSTHNEKGMRGMSWSTDYNNVGGAVDVYGLDSYPGGLSCTNPDTGFNVGGWFNGWGDSNYDDCETMLSPEFPDVYYKNNIGQKGAMLGLYMTFGGTSWGHTAAPVVFTSYDYSAPLRETREIRTKMQQTKLLGLFTRVSKGLFSTNMEGNGTGYAVSSNEIWSWVLRNPFTGAGFYTLQHNNTKSRDSTTFEVHVNTSAGPISIPDVNLNGRQSKIVVTDYPIGTNTLLYSSGEVLTYAPLDKDVVVFYLDGGQVGEFAFTGLQTPILETYGEDSDIQRSNSSNGTSSFTYIQGAGISVVDFSNDALFYLVSREAAWTFHAPPTVQGPAVEPDEQIFVFGPYLVRDAKLSGDSVLITGDISDATSIEVYTGSSDVQTIVWNSRRLATVRTPYGALQADIASPSAEFSVPTIGTWRTANSLPESSPSYDDSLWTIANKTTTLAPVEPVTLPILFASDYGFYPGVKVYRGYFPTQNASSLTVTAANGLAAGWSAWLNGKLLHSYPGVPGVDRNNATIALPRDLLLNGTTRDNATENVLTVVVGYTGHDQTSTAQGIHNPRGLLGAQLLGSQFSQWKIRGAVPAILDPVRGPMNEGGLYGERLGWHLPDFDSSSWEEGSPSDGIPSAGVQWYTTSVPLSIPDGFDIPLGFELSSPEDTVARIGIWVNGYMMGKFVPHIGPQFKFLVQPGIWNTQGDNKIGVAIWAQEDSGASVDVKIVEMGRRYESGFELGFRGDEGLKPSWEAGREKYS